MKKFIDQAISILDRIVPKDKNIIVFGANEMRGINGNVKAVLRSWPKNPKTKTFRSYVISVHNEKFLGIETIDPRSLKGIVILLRSYTAVVSHVYSDLYWHTLYSGKGRRMINLWHGIPLKRIGPWRGLGKTTILIASSKAERLALSACTELRLENIFVTGFPRSDRLFNDLKNLRQEAIKKLNLKNVEQKWILYAPTYRKSSRVPHYLHKMPDFSYKELVNFLQKHNASLIVRPHVNYIFSDFKENDRIIFAPYSKLPEIEPLYALADILVTDYSSSFFEYLNINRPIIGLVPDLEEYEKIPGLLYDYESIFPGPLARNWSTLQKLISEALKDPKKYSSLREDRKRLFNQFTDGNSTKRCIELICNLSIK